ncbi:pyridoxamine 5'-phosphate oxidase family protein [Streptomyces sp. CS7]|uniref:pyridoxamine 5'-phosphate oxidase family protein n=1 Tax=Streptomyces sp. CS-7 TaxID=2906769 RepID=UPI0021B23904|nr:pyridoxamine 5'-phosphate oxidase family protein [Streptomyces sp. CS-7]MCT6778274.1 pyridoxamine 5'-phosphate oxidase family protein [Streptomyces sp. CS-7]
MIRSPHHEGEQAVQRRAGEGHPGWGSPMFDNTVQPGFAAFLREQPMLFLGAADADGAVWASVLTGAAGFVDTVDPHQVVVDAAPVPGDPLADAFTAPRDLGVLALDPRTIRRIRLSGVARRQGGRLRIATEQVLGNCPKYLQRRELVESDAPVGDAPAAVRHELGPRERQWIAAADTFFIASRAPGHGADASHRGGEPGFVTVESPRRLSWPDYPGNSFYMTLGNLSLDAACGLLFLDWERGHTLQLTGRARIDWDPDHRAALPGALRRIEFDVERVVTIDRAVPHRWALMARSRFNPPPPASCAAP